VVTFRVEDDPGSIVESIAHVKLDHDGSPVDLASSKAFGS